MNKDPKKIEGVKKQYSELNEEQRQLVDKVLKMLGETIGDIDRINIGENGGIILQTGKPNIERFIKMAMEYMD